MSERAYKKRAFTTESIGINSIVVHYFGFENCKPSHTWSGTRDHYVLHYVICGKGSYEKDGKIYSLSKGDFFIIKPNKKITYIADDKDPWEYCWVAFGGSDPVILLSHTDFSTQSVIKNKEEQHERTLSLFNSFFNNKEDTVSARLKLINIFYEIFIMLIKQAEEKRSPTKAESSLYDITKYISENIHNSNLSVSSIAKQVGFSQSSLYRDFCAAFGVSPIKYIIELRMKRASELLRNTNMTVAEISDLVGFSNPLYFSKYFKKYFLLSPRQFKKKYENKEFDMDRFKRIVE